MIASEIMLPPHAPEIYLDRATLWNAVESCEKHPKEQLAYSFDIAMQINGAFGHKIFNGTGLAYTNMSIFPDYNVLKGAPEKNIIDKYTSLVTEIFNRQRTIICEIKLLIEARDRLLPKLMSGEIEV